MQSELRHMLLVRDETVARLRLLFKLPQPPETMSQPKRYRPALDDGSREPWMKESELGGYVEHAAYAALQAENERLRKAGDAVIEKLAEAYAGEPSDFDHAHVFKGWIEAKGVQS